MHIVFVSLGAFGHINPTLALVTELLRQGVRVTYFTTEAFRKDDLHLAGKVEPMETVVNELVRAIKARHIARLQAGSCSIEYGFVLDDLLTSYSRVCDHCSNVAVAQIEVAQDSFDTHAYLKDLRHGNAAEESEAFRRRLDRYRARYPFPAGTENSTEEK